MRKNLTPRSDAGKKRGPYKTKTEEVRGRTEGEPKYMKAFWREHTMEEMITKTDDEIKSLTAEFIDKYVASQLSRNPRWDFPEKLKKYNA